MLVSRFAALFALLTVAVATPLRIRQEEVIPEEVAVSSEGGTPEVIGQQVDPALNPEVPAQQVDPALNPEVNAQQVDPALNPEVIGQQVDPALNPEVVGQQVDPALNPEVVGQQVDPALNPEVIGQQVDPALNPEVIGQQVDPALNPEVIGQQIDPALNPEINAQVIKPEPVSFNGWGGFKSLDNFDDFNGKDNFDGWKFKQVFPHVEKKLVCKQVPKVVIVQQRLLVLQELAKKIITETICEVEAQSIVWDQFHAGIGGFGRDIRRVPGHHQIGFDEKIVNHFPKIIKNDGHLNLDDWQFTGHDLGKNSIIVDGHNWNPKHSFGNVRKAWRATRTALGHLAFPW